MVVTTGAVNSLMLWAGLSVVGSYYFLALAGHRRAKNQRKQETK